jgi:hypothetical protein
MAQRKSLVVIPADRVMSASKGEVFVNCVYGWSDGAQWGEKPGAYSQRLGNGFHGASESWLNNRLTPDWKAISERWDMTPRMLEAVQNRFNRWLAYIETQPLDKMHPEIAYAYDPWAGVGRELERKKHRDYSSVSTTEAFTGTADAVANVESDRVEGWDWKSGWLRPKPAEHNQQMRYLALYMSRTYGVSSVTMHVVRFGEWDFFDSVHTFDVFELSEIADQARHVAERKKAGIGPIPGEHCHQCKMVGCDERLEKPKKVKEAAE